MLRFWGIGSITFHPASMLRATAAWGLGAGLPRTVLILVLPFLLARCGGLGVNCDLTEVAKLPLEVHDRLLVVPAGINGKRVHLVVDTGAERTTISDATADRLGLVHDLRFTTRSMGVGGVTVNTDVKLDSFVLGDTRFPVQRMAVAPFKLHTARGLDADGLLGADILLAFDMDIDVPNNQLTLYRRRVCPNFRPPWQEEAVEIPGVQVRKTRLLLPVVLDGAEGMAILDTGAQGSVVGIPLAHRLGLDERALAADPVVRQRGVGPNEALSRLHRFKLLRIGPTATPSPVITVLPTEVGIGDMLIGEDFLRGRRVWLSYKPPQVFVSQRK